MSLQPAQRTNPLTVLGDHEARVRALEREQPGRWIYVGTYPDDLDTTPDSPPFENGWMNYGTAGDRRMRFRRTRGGNIQIAGVVVGGTDGSVVFTAPQNYRITEREQATGVNPFGEPVEWSFEPDGSLVYMGTLCCGGGDITASEVIFDPTTDIPEDNVQDAIVEVKQEILDHIGDPVDAHDASAISFSPTTDVPADDVQEAIEELVALIAGSGAVASVFGRTGAVVAVAGDYYAVIPAALTGATQAFRIAGATTSGAPVSGTFAVGDLVAARDGHLWMCIVAGSPGTFVDVGTYGSPSFATPSIALGTAAAAGAAGTVIRSDATIVAFDATVPSTQGFGDAAATGAAAVAARRDHKHAMPATPTSVSGNAGTATALQTSRAIDGQTFDGTADITVIAPGTHAASSKTTPVDADELPLVDTAASNVLKKLTGTNLKAYLKTYFDTLYAAVGGGTQGTEIGYDQITSSVNVTATSEASGTTIITCAAHTFDGSPVIAEFFSPTVTCPQATAAFVFNIISLWEGATQIGRLAVLADNEGTGTLAAIQSALTGRYRFTPSAGSHTYIVKAHVSGTVGTPSVNAGSGGTGAILPAFIRFTKV